MKKTKILIVSVLLLIGMIACSRQLDNDNTQPEFTQGAELSSSAVEEESTSEESTEIVTDALPESITDLTVHYVRGGDSSTKEQEPRIIYSADEFKSYCEQENGFASKAEFQTVSERYDETFWANYDLILVKRSENSGSFRHEVLKMSPAGELTSADWVIDVRVKVPGAYNQALATWMFLIEVPKGVLEKDDVIKMDYLSPMF